MTGRTAVVLLAISLGLVACSSEPDPAEHEPEPTPAEPSEPEPEERPAENPAPPPEPPPLAEADEVRVRTEDGVELVGDLRVGASPSAPLVVLVHQLSSTRAEWEPLLRHLGAEPALTTYAFDVRGHGQSTRRGRGEVGWESFETADWERVADDVAAVVERLQGREDLSPRSVILVGSSIGSSAVIRAAADMEDVDAVVALSPGRAYQGVDAITPLPRLGNRPLFLIASAEETGTAAIAEDMARIAPSGEAMIAEGEAHGVRMFEADPQALPRVVAFIRQR